VDFSNTKILVTGSSGTIGTCLFETLLEKDANVVGVDIRPNRWNEEVNRRTINIDLRNPEDVNKLPKDFDMVVHLTWQRTTSCSYIIFWNLSGRTVLKEFSLPVPGKYTATQVISFILKKRLSLKIVKVVIPPQRLPEKP
jgi:GDP-D-mannose dehydratase